MPSLQRRICIKAEPCCWWPVGLRLSCCSGRTVLLDCFTVENPRLITESFPLEAIYRVEYFFRIENRNHKLYTLCTFSQLGCFVGCSICGLFLSIDHKPITFCGCQRLVIFLGFTVLTAAEACMACIGHLSVSFVQLGSQLVRPAESWVCILSTRAKEGVLFWRSETAVYRSAKFSWVIRIASCPASKFLDQKHSVPAEPQSSLMAWGLLSLEVVWGLSCVCPMLHLILHDTPDVYVSVLVGSILRPPITLRTR